MTFGRKINNVTIKVDGKMTVRDLVGHYPQTRPVFEKHGIDYCGRGGKCLAEAASEHGLKLPALIDALEKALQAPAGKAEATDKDWYAAPLAELVQHIVEVHHGYMKTALPRLRGRDSPSSRQNVLGDKDLMGC
jgi:regulator of cell morphogenesis and NO signaling